MIPDIFAGHAALLQKPWGAFLPSDVAKLSFRQVKHLYLEPAAEQAKRMQEDKPGGRRTADQEPTWEVFLAEVGGHYRGKTLAELRQIHAKIHAAWVAEMNKKGTANGRD